MNFPKKTVGALAGLGGLGYLIANYAPEVGKTIGTIVGDVDGVFEKGSELINNISEPIIGSAAPFAFPMIAGGYLGKKISDAIGIEGKWKKRAATVLGTGVGAGLGIAASTSVLAPYLTMAGAGYGVYKGAQLIKWSGKKLIGGTKGFYNGVKAA